MNIGPAIKNMQTKGNKITRVAYDGKSHIEMRKGEMVRVRKNGTVSRARFMSEDVVANDWKVKKV